MSTRNRYYQDGNTVRKEEVWLPEESRRLRRIEKAAEKKASRRAPFYVPYVLTLMLVTAMFGYLCTSYIGLQARISASMGHISDLEEQLADLKSDNDVMENRLTAQLDLEEVYRAATEELGMVYPDESEHLVFENAPREYVRQYEDIPND